MASTTSTKSFDSIEISELVQSGANTAKVIYAVQATPHHPLRRARTTQGLLNAKNDIPPNAIFRRNCPMWPRQHQRNQSAAAKFQNWFKVAQTPQKSFTLCKQHHITLYDVPEQRKDCPMPKMTFHQTQFFEGIALYGIDNINEISRQQRSFRIGSKWRKRRKSHLHCASNTTPPSTTCQNNARTAQCQKWHPTKRNFLKQNCPIWHRHHQRNQSAAAKFQNWFKVAQTPQKSFMLCNQHHTTLYDVPEQRKDCPMPKMASHQTQFFEAIALYGIDNINEISRQQRSFRIGSKWRKRRKSHLHCATNTTPPSTTCQNNARTAQCQKWHPTKRNFLKQNCPIWHRHHQRNQLAAAKFQNWFKVAQTPQKLFTLCKQHHTTLFDVP